VGASIALSTTDYIEPFFFGSLRQRKDNFLLMRYCPAEMKMDTEMTINNLLKQHPAATNVFIRRMMLCVGCPAAGFHTLQDAAKLYGHQLDELSREIEWEIRKRRSQ
jgi:hybrid cluster-associated redox disulfide protein